MYQLTTKAVLYLLSEEGMVLEAYKDSVGVWTWAGGVTNQSGHLVYPRYKDDPQSLDQCLKITLWLIRNKYLEPVWEAFDGKPLSEAQLGAALSFQWNTGAIKKASWVKSFLADDVEKARTQILDWSSHGQLIARRKREQRLFFLDQWPGSLLVPIYPVKKPSYTPDWGHAKAVDLSVEVRSLLRD